MAADRFLDTNILIYAFAWGDNRNARAEALLADGGVVGVQVPATGSANSRLASSAMPKRRNGLS